MTKDLAQQSVIWGYRLFLDREPDDQEAVQDKVRGFTSSQELRREFMNSEEFKRKEELSYAPTLSGNEPGMAIQNIDSFADLQALLSHIKATWEYLGETEPHWSVLTGDQFKRSNIKKNEDAFFSSGQEDVVALYNTLDRNGIDYTSFKRCLEYGCGLGRVTRWLSQKFETVLAYDVSRSHLQGAEKYLNELGIRNVKLHNIDNPNDIGDFPKVDLVYSVIVLQHNPPPIISLIIRGLTRALTSGGIAFFQVPTYRIGYKFSLREYMTNEITGREMEMHVLPQSEIFDIVRKEGGNLVEILEDKWAGSRYGARSNTFLIQKE